MLRTISAFSLYGEYVVRSFLPNGVFLPCDHGPGGLSLFDESATLHEAYYPSRFEGVPGLSWNPSEGPTKASEEGFMKPP